MRVPPQAAHTHVVAAPANGPVISIDNRRLARVAKGRHEHGKRNACQQARRSTNSPKRKPDIRQLDCQGLHDVAARHGLLADLRKLHHQHPPAARGARGPGVNVHHPRLE